MSKDETREGLAPTHHALLLAWMARAVVQRVGEDKGETVVRGAVRRYGEQRGKRMAMRAQANGHALTMTNYLAYGEWTAPKGERGQSMVERAPHARALVHKCPWHAAWEENDLMPYGRLYCLEIDEALIRGFNPELRLDVNSTQATGGEQCEFVFYDANLTVKNSLSLMYKRAVKPGKRAFMPWDYHLGHLYKTVGDVVVAELGPAGQEAINDALAEFANRYGEEAAQIVKAYEETDFDRLPESR